MEYLTQEFDDKRYPFKYLLKAPLSGAGNFAKRLASAAENLGFDAPMARQFVEAYDDQGGGASYHLFAVALTQEDHYPRLLTELDRLTSEHFQSMDKRQAGYEGMSHSEALLKDYHDQEEQVGQTHALGYEDLGRDGELPVVRDDLLADWLAQDDPASAAIERDTLDDEWELGL